MLKRLFDILASAAGLLFLAPVFGLVALAIKFDSPGPVFFRQIRVGRHGQYFRIFKFRTMEVAQPDGAAEITVAGDPRITRIGRLIRRYKLDELPQLIDVLRGTMSLVGPRPEVPRYVERYPAEWRDRVLSVRPGITDYASVHYRDENDILAKADDPERKYIEVIMPSKLRYALHYVDNLTLSDDLKVLGLTIRTVFVPTLSKQGGLFAMNDSKLWVWLDRNMPMMRPHRRLRTALADLVVVLACWHFTYLFRLGFERYSPGRPWYDDYVSFGVAVVYLACLAATGVSRGFWRHFGFDDLRRITLACLLAGLISAVGVLMGQLVGVARGVLVLHPLFCIVALSLVRMAARMLWEHVQAVVNGQADEPKRAIVLGAGEVARRLVAGIHMRDGWTLVAMLDDDLAKRGMRIEGVPVIGPLADLALPHICQEATHVIVAMPDASAEQLTNVLALARQVGLKVLTVPDQSELRADAG